MTQPEFFLQYISQKDFIESGLMARTLLYRYQGSMSPFHSQSPMAPNIKTAFCEKLFALLDAADAADRGKDAHRIITISHDAEAHLAVLDNNWRRNALYFGNLELQSFIVRMKQHAIRLAGCLYLAENPIDSSEPISLQLMQTATSMAEVFFSHTLRWVTTNGDKSNMECCRAIMVYIVNNNLQFVYEKDLKYHFHHTFKAKDIENALLYLVSFGHLRIANNGPLCSSPFNAREMKHLTGNIYSNPYYKNIYFPGF